MGSWNRVWIFFVIVAVGLILSWGQLGKRAQQSMMDDATEYLYTESDCQPLSTPCAATGGALGLVLGPLSGSRLLLKATSTDIQLDSVVLATRAAGPRAMTLPFAKYGDGAWRIELPAGPYPDAAEVRVKLAAPAVAAAYPLR